MKFAHLADCHLGCWRDEKLRALGLANFRAALDRCLAEHVGFVLISGDLFDVALPSIAVLSEVTEQLQRLRQAGITCYTIAGSHDYSASGKSMLDVLEQAGLVVHVMHLVEGQLSLVHDDHTGVSLCGYHGRKGGLEFSKEKISLQQVPSSFSIFMFHTLLSELKPASYAPVPSSSLSLLPRGFSYYAGGHPHFVYSKHHEGYGVISYPGPLFPTNFSELEQLHGGGFFLVQVTDGAVFSYHVPLCPVTVVSFTFDVTGKHPQDIASLVCSSVEDCAGKIVTLRFFGTLASGVVADIPFAEIYAHLALSYCVLRSTTKVVSPLTAELVLEGEHVTDIETHLLTSSISEMHVFENESAVVCDLLSKLHLQKQEGETVHDFEKRVLQQAQEILQ